MCIPHKSLKIFLYKIIAKKDNLLHAYNEPINIYSADLAMQYKIFTSLPELSGREKVLEVGSNRSITLAGSLVGRRVVWLYNSPI